MSDLFKKYLPEITNKTTKNFAFNEDEYVPYVINRALMNYPDTVLLANEMNCRPDLPKEMQFDYLRYSVRKKYREYVPWSKAKNHDYLNEIAWYFNVSTKDAAIYAKVLNDEQLHEITTKYQRIVELKNGTGKRRKTS